MSTLNFAFKNNSQYLTTTENLPYQIQSLLHNANAETFWPPHARRRSTLRYRLSFHFLECVKSIPIKPCGSFTATPTRLTSDCGTRWPMSTFWRKWGESKFTQPLMPSVLAKPSPITTQCWRDSVLGANSQYQTCIKVSPMRYSSLTDTILIFDALTTTNVLRQKQLQRRNFALPS